MVILRSCCCWKSLKKGCIACGVYTLIYYTLNALQAGCLFNEAKAGLLKNTSFPVGQISGSTAFLYLVVTVSSCGIATSIILLFGILKNIKVLLMPWVLNMVVFTILDVIYVLHGLITQALKWTPSVAILLILDFFVDSLNVYTLLCVVSQYQDYQVQEKRIKSHPDVQATCPNVEVPLEKTAKQVGENEKRPKAVTFLEIPLKGDKEDSQSKQDMMPLII